MKYLLKGGERSAVGSQYCHQLLALNSTFVWQILTIGTERRANVQNVRAETEEKRKPVEKIHYININGLVYQMKEQMGYFVMDFQNNNFMLLLRSALRLVLYVKR